MSPRSRKHFLFISFLCFHSLSRLCCVYTHLYMHMDEQSSLRARMYTHLCVHKRLQPFFCESACTVTTVYSVHPFLRADFSWIHSDLFSFFFAFIGIKHFNNRAVDHRWSAMSVFGHMVVKGAAATKWPKT